MATIDELDQLFTPVAASAWRAAVRQPGELGHTWFGTEHVLLGILAVPDDAASRLLTAYGVRAEQIRARIQQWGSGRPDDAALLAGFGIDLDAVREHVTARFGADAVAKLYTRRRGWRRRRPAWGPLCGPVRVCPRLKRALQATHELAARAGSAQIDTRDVLVGVLTVEDSMAVQLLRGEGVDTAALRAELETRAGQP